MTKFAGRTRTISLVRRKKLIVTSVLGKKTEERLITLKICLKSLIFTLGTTIALALRVYGGETGLTLLPLEEVSWTRCPIRITEKMSH